MAGKVDVLDGEELFDKGGFREDWAKVMLTPKSGIATTARSSLFRLFVIVAKFKKISLCLPRKADCYGAKVIFPQKLSIPLGAAARRHKGLG